ncbi:hypothetical protein BDV98DRAFT_365409 [Pterulicium gracile]|uniref:Uncharacterized protein n=1 Tax=Pterulicium gracile TaxID=1884261 RepID=A0A5C3QS91_9AGAR|nr:hypothetical protein BDV98DRAFT_365409 [Pterula gracilis]
MHRKRFSAEPGRIDSLTLYIFARPFHHDVYFPSFALVFHVHLALAYALAVSILKC